MRYLVIALMLSIALPAAGRPDFTPEIGARLPLDSRFRTGDGADLSLAQALDGKPALLLFGYNDCPNLCGVAQQAVASELPDTGLTTESYRALFISIDRGETAEDARDAKARLAEATHPDMVRPWRFLVGPDGAGARLAHTAGITFEPQSRVGQFVHPIAIFALTPEGRIARVLPAMAFDARDLRLALIEASEGTLGSIADQVFLLCAGFDSTKGQYTSVVWASLQAGGVATALALGVAVLWLARRRRR